MDQATITMIENLHKNTGKTLEQWIDVVQQKGIDKHGAIITFLKQEHALTHGYTNLVALKAKGSDAGSATNPNDLVTSQYKGKEHLKPLYDGLMKKITAFGNDIEVAPKNAYVSLRRKKQFAILQPATKTRFEIGLNLNGQEPAGLLQAITTPNAMCSHKINLQAQDALSEEVLGWIKAAYDKAG